jgi:hypothetical protein
VSEPARELPQASRPTTTGTNNDSGPSVRVRGQYSRDVKYTTWTALAFEALARTGDGSYGGVRLPAVAATLGFDGVTWNDFAKHEGMPNALVTAMGDLARLGLVTFENIDWGNELTPLGRDIADAGLASIWTELATIHVSAQETSFLSKLYEASVIEEDRWADLLFADADEVAGLSGLEGGDHADLIRHRTFLGDLERKGLLEAGPRFGGAPAVDRPTYITAVILTETIEGDRSRVVGSVDATSLGLRLELKPGVPRPRGRPKGSRYIADCQSVVDAYRRAKKRTDRNPSAIPPARQSPRNSTCPSGHWATS